MSVIYCHNVFGHMFFGKTFTTIPKKLTFYVFHCPGHVLKNLKYLDLTGLYISRLSSVGEQWSLPPLLEALILRDTLINLYNITLLEAIAKQHQLKELDISLSQLGFEELKILSEGLDSLEVFSMAGKVNSTLIAPHLCNFIILK